MTTWERRESPEVDFVLRLARTAWYLGCLTMPALSLRVANFTLSDLSFAVAVVLAALTIRFRGQSQPTLVFASLLIAVAALLAATRSVDVLANYAVAARLIFLWIVWRWLAIATLGTKSSLRHSILFYMLGAAASSLTGVAQVFGGASFLPSTLAETGRAPGLAVHVNDQGGQLAVAVSLGLALVLYRHDKDNRTPVVAAILTSVCVAGLILSGSVTATLSTLVGVAFIISRRRNFRARTVLIATILALPGIYGASKLQSTLANKTDPVSRLLSVTDGTQINTYDLRLLTEKVAWRGITEHPFVGTGMDTSSGGTYDGVTLTHNIFLLFWYQGGALMLLALMIVVFTALPLALHRDPMNSSLQEGVAGALIAALVYSQFSPIAFQRYFWLPFILSFVLVAIRKRSFTKDVDRSLPDAVALSTRPGKSLRLH